MTFIQTLFVVATMLFANPTKPVVNNLSGKVTDSKSGEVLIFATVKVFQAGKFIRGTETDMADNYFFSAPPVGLIDIEVQYVGYEAIMIKNFDNSLSGANTLESTPTFTQTVVKIAAKIK